MTRSFSVTDSQKAVSVARVADESATGALSTIAGNAFTFTYDGTVYTNNADVKGDNVKAAVITKVEGIANGGAVKEDSTIAPGTSVFVKTVTVKIPVVKDSTTVYFTVKVDVNKTVTAK